MIRNGFTVVNCSWARDRQVCPYFVKMASLYVCGLLWINDWGEVEMILQELTILHTDSIEISGNHDLWLFVYLKDSP